jgi:saccharopepsin
MTPENVFSFSVQNQAFLDVSSAQNPAITYGTSGIIGLGFTSLSTIDAVLNKTGSSSGRSLLYNLFSAKPLQPNFIAFSLQRSTDPTDDVQGTFLIGELDPDYAMVNQTSPIPTFPEDHPIRWNILLEAILIGNTAIPLTSIVSNAPPGNAVALLDSGTSYRCVSISSQLKSWLERPVVTRLPMCATQFMGTSQGPN